MYFAKLLIMSFKSSLFFLLSSILPFLLRGQAPPPPNVVLVLIDNQSYFELSSNGHEIVQTPRLDRLAREGVHFTDFHAPPFCSPSRAAMLTGRYALRAGIHNTVGGISILHKQEKTVAEFLKEAGYSTGVFGKWHLGFNYPYDPSYRGFDEVFVHGGGGVSQLEDYYGNNHLNATFQHNGKYVKSRGFSTDVLFDQGIDFIQRNQENPFFCLIATPAVHFPTLKHPEVTKRLLARGVPESNQLAIYSMIENVDDNVGRLLDHLDNIGLASNTLLIVASDQGVNDRGAPVHRAGKQVNRGVQYDEKHQVYCMMQFPSWTDKNPGPIDELCGMVDITPTILEFCGLIKPKNLDGQSLIPLLKGSGTWNEERKLIVQCPRKRSRKKWENVSVKYKKWRLVDGQALYNIEKDRGQLINVINEHPNLTKALKDEYEAFWNSLDPAEELIPPHHLGAPEDPEVRLNGMDWYVGDAPWTQQSLAKKTSQGKWLVEVVQDGVYRFELRRYPQEASLPIGATLAEVKLGEKGATVETEPSAKKAVLELDLKAGRYDLQTIFTNTDPESGLEKWGAYYVYVAYLGQN